MHHRACAASWLVASVAGACAAPGTDAIHAPAPTVAAVALPRPETKLAPPVPIVAPPEAALEPTPKETPSPEAPATIPPPAPSMGSLPVLSPSAPFQVEIGENFWRLTALVHSELPPFSFTVRGGVGQGGRDEDPDPGLVMVGGWGAGPWAPAFVEVEHAGAVARLVRHGPQADPLDLNSFASVESLELRKKPKRTGSDIGAGDLALIDYDFDGYLDLEVAVGLGHKCQNKQVWLFRPGLRIFEESLPLQAMNCVSADARTKRVVTHTWTCCEHRYTYYRWRNGALEPESATTDEYVSMTHQVPEGKSYVTEYTWKNGGWIVVHEGLR